MSVNVWHLQLGDLVKREIALRMFGTGAKRGRVVAIQRRRNRVQVEWENERREWHAAGELTCVGYSA